VLYRIGEEFYTTTIPADDAVLRDLQNAALRETLPIEPARKLARFLARTGRCREAVLEYDRLARFVPLTREEIWLVESCRRAAAEEP
jgi:hypothetical protein